MLTIFFKDALDLFNGEQHFPSDLARPDLPLLSPAPESHDGDAEVVGRLLDGEGLVFGVHRIKLSRGIPVSFEILRASIFPRPLLLLK